MRYKTPPCVFAIDSTHTADKRRSPILMVMSR